MVDVRRVFEFLIGVAVLDVSIATALFGSSHVFWASDTSRE